jgi:hypothetical protein
MGGGCNTKNIYYIRRQTHRRYIQKKDISERFPSFWLSSRLILLYIHCIDATLLSLILVFHLPTPFYFSTSNFFVTFCNCSDKTDFSFSVPFLLIPHAFAGLIKSVSLFSLSKASFHNKDKLLLAQSMNDPDISITIIDPV